MDDALADRLAKVDLFEGLSRRELKRVAASAREVTHRSGHTVIDEGGVALGFHLILDGRATVTTPSGTKRELGPGDYFGEISLVDGLPRSASVVAEGSLHTLYLNSSGFHTLIGEHPDIAKAMLAVLCRRIRALEQA